MFLNLLDRDPSTRLLVGHLANQISSFSRHICRYLQLGKLDVIIKYLDILRIIWRKTDKKLVEDGSHLVDICRLAHSFPIEHLRWQIGRAPDESVSFLVRFLVPILSKAKVSQSDVTVFTYEKILWLHVSINNAK